MTYSSEESCNASIHENTGLDGIALCIPTMLQSKYIKICAQYGLAIFCEKPVAVSPNESFQRRFDESYIALAEAISRGDIGKSVLRFSLEITHFRQLTLGKVETSSITCVYMIRTLVSRLSVVVGAGLSQ
jgi:hypothetical protein